MTDANSSAVGVIPARHASTRFPGKMLAPLLGKPLILWVVERAHLARKLDRVIVATDDDRIAAVVRDAGYEVCMTSPDHPSGTDRIAEAVRDLSCQTVINIQGDEPTIDPVLIDNLVDALAQDPTLDMVTAACTIQNQADFDNPGVVKVVTDGKGRALYFSRCPIPYHRDQDGSWVPGAHLRHIGIYGYRSGFLREFITLPPSQLENTERLEQLRALENGAHIRVLLTDHESIGVDTPEDIPLAEKKLRELSGNP